MKLARGAGGVRRTQLLALRNSVPDGHGHRLQIQVGMFEARAVIPIRAERILIYLPVESPPVCQSALVSMTTPPYMALTAVRWLLKPPHSVTGSGSRWWRPRRGIVRGVGPQPMIGPGDGHVGFFL